MKLSLWVVLIYADIVLLGGVLGYLQAGSKISLAAGLLFGISLNFCALQMFKKKMMATYIALLLIFLLDGFFTFRFIKSLQFMPAGLMSLISLAVILTMVCQLRREAK